MASDTKLVAIGVAEVCAVVVLVILGPQTWSTIGSAAIGQSGFKRAANAGSALSKERDHLTIARMMWLLIVGLGDDKQRARIGT